MAMRFIIHQEKPIKLPNGRIRPITYIEHPGAVIVAPMLNNNTVLMLRQFRPALGKYIYELPAGTIDRNESLITCVRRELIEETGYRARAIKKLGSIYPVPGYSTEIIYMFVASGLTAGKAEPEEYEVIDLKPMTKPQVKKLFKSGKLMDAKSICVLAHLGWL